MFDNAGDKVGERERRQRKRGSASGQVGKWVLAGGAYPSSDK